MLHYQAQNHNSNLRNNLSSRCSKNQRLVFCLFLRNTLICHIQSAYCHEIKGLEEVPVFTVIAACAHIKSSETGNTSWRQYRCNQWCTTKSLKRIFFFKAALFKKHRAEICCSQRLLGPFLIFFLKLLHQLKTLLSTTK